jgi:hypothetical protein
LLQTLLTALWCSKGTRLIIASRQQKSHSSVKWPTNSARRASANVIVGLNSTSFVSLYGRLWLCCCCCLPISPELFHSLYSVAARLYFYTSTHAHAGDAACTKKARAAASAPSLLSLCAVGFTLAVTLPSLFPFFQVAAHPPNTVYNTQQFCPADQFVFALFSPLCELSLRVHCSVSCVCVCGAKINNPKTYPILYNSQCRA